MLPFHYRRRRTHVSFTAVIGMNVLQHCLSRQRAWISKPSVKIADALGVSACTTDERRTLIVCSDDIYSHKNMECLPSTDVICVTFQWIAISL